MRRFVPLALLVATASALPAQPLDLANGSVSFASAADPADVLRGLEDGARWLGWSVPAVSSHEICCMHGKGRRRCRLEEGNRGFSVFDAPPGAPARELMVLLRWEDGRATDLLALSENCPLDARGQEILWLEGVEPEASLELLRQMALTAGEDLQGQALPALAHHAGPRAEGILEELAGAPHGLELREKAIFWLGEARGRGGYEILERLLAARPEAEIEEKIVFAFYISEVPEADAALARLARQSPRAETRREALFWLAQEGAPGVEEILLAAAASPDEEERDHAVFALSQLPDGRAVDALIAALRTIPAARQQALFWLSQSDDPRALDEVERLLED